MDNLYLTDAYCREVNTSVEEVRTIKKKTAVCLTDNIFYPGGGGQPPDTGSLGLGSGAIVPVVRVLKLDGKVFACLSSVADVHAGDNVHAVLDWPKRYAYMQYHTAAHIVMGAIRRKVANYEPEGIEIAEDASSCTANFSGQWQRSDAVMLEIEQLANAQIRNSAKVEVITHASLGEAIEKYGDIYRGPSSLAGPVRIIIAAGWDANPCGGTHVRSTDEVGEIRLTEFGDNYVTMQLTK
jgi:Ser-tRNA(Ala) deacylase AlaX